MSSLRPSPVRLIFDCVPDVLLTADVFKSGFEIATRLYPHQKKALTFLLDRERERPASDSFSSLWQTRNSHFTGKMSWFNVVTQKEVSEAPKEAKGAILADDVGGTPSGNFAMCT